MKKVFFDIETLPATDKAIRAQIKAKLSPPANMSKPETIQKWMDDPANLDAAIRKTSFNGALGQILCIGYAIDDGKPQVAEGGPGKEKDAIAEFLEVIREGKARNNALIIGHNNINFDNVFLSQRMMIHGFGPLFPFNAKPWDSATDDTMQMFCTNPRDKVSLENLCISMGIPSPKDEIDGSMIYDAWLAEENQLIFDYCKKDVDRTRQVYNRMQSSLAA